MAGVNSLKTKLRRTLLAQFPGAEVSLTDPSETARLGGTVVWAGFVGKDQVDRHRSIRESLAKAMTPDERAQLGAIFALTPEEVAVMNS
jgi:hypothetical protein